MPERKKRVLTGVKPTGVPHIGNYLGAMRPALELSKTYDSFLFIADLHALTTRQNPKELEEQTYSVAATWLACGLDPRQVVLYKQSDIPEIPILSWMLACVTPFGLLRRAVSFKDAQEKYGEDEINCGLFTYPVLMAADILLFDIDFVPVGKDQKQHLEIAQEAARKLNNAYGEGREILRVPEPKIDEAVMTVPGLDGRKMSKSYNNAIDIFATPAELEKRLKLIKTDSTQYGSALKAEGETIFQLHKLFASPAESERLLAQYASGRKDPSRIDEDKTNFFGWGDAKKALSAAINAELEGPRKEYERLMADRPYVRKLLAEGAEKARVVAREVMDRVTSAVGLVR